MKYTLIKDTSDKEFRRLTGIKKTTFYHMVEIIRNEDVRKKAQGGRKNKLSIEDQILAFLEYYREYRPFFHIGKSYNISESTAFRIIRWIEDTLSKHPDFTLPGKKTLIEEMSRDDVVLIDVTESPIERPKKNKKCTTQAKRKNIR